MLTQTLFELNSLSTGCSKSGVGRPKIFFFLPLLATLDLHFNSKQIRKTPKTNFFVLELLGIILNTALSQHCFYTKLSTWWALSVTELWQHLWDSGWNWVIACLLLNCKCKPPVCWPLSCLQFFTGLKDREKLLRPKQVVHSLSNDNHLLHPPADQITFYINIKSQNPKSKAKFRNLEIKNLCFIHLPIKSHLLHKNIFNVFVAIY